MGVHWNLNFRRECVENRQSKTQNSFEMALEASRHKTEMQVESFLLQFFQKMEFRRCFISFPYILS